MTFLYLARDRESEPYLRLDTKREPPILAWWLSLFKRRQSTSPQTREVGSLVRKPLHYQP
jgi:hypothetical protein